jgi:tRNA pseudouridine13 synthase
LGAPNYFGAQRFGVQGDNAVHGKTLLKGERLARAPSRFERRMFLSAYQSELFNRLLAQRVSEGSLNRALLGDVLCKEASGGMFVCEDVAIDQPRVASQEVSPAGPLFGPKLLAAKGEVAEREAAILRDEGLSLGDFARGRGETEGARRSYRVLIREPHRERVDGDLLLRFVLPAGSYATVVLAEIIKEDSATSGLETESDAG